MKRWRQYIAAAALCVLCGPALAQGLDHEHQYEACLALTYRDPDAALEAADSWAAQGGGPAARHCAAMAHIEARRYARAAALLEELAAALPPDGEPTPDQVLAQAANAWLLAEEPQRALAAIGAALQGAPASAGLLIDRARILADLGRYADALDDLDAAAGEAPEDDDLAAFRAAALRHLGEVEAALEEAERAVMLNAQNPSAWLERALARLQSGNTAGARSELAETAARFAGTPAADAAERQLRALGPE